MEAARTVAQAPRASMRYRRAWQTFPRAHPRSPERILSSRANTRPSSRRRPPRCRLCYIPVNNTPESTKTRALTCSSAPRTARLLLRLCSATSAAVAFVSNAHRVARKAPLAGRRSVVSGHNRRPSCHRHNRPRNRADGPRVGSSNGRASEGCRIRGEEETAKVVSALQRSLPRAEHRADTARPAARSTTASSAEACDASTELGRRHSALGIVPPLAGTRYTVSAQSRPHGRCVCLCGPRHGLEPFNTTAAAAKTSAGPVAGPCGPAPRRRRQPPPPLHATLQALPPRGTLRFWSTNNRRTRAVLVVAARAALRAGSATTPPSSQSARRPSSRGHFATAGAHARSHKHLDPVAIDGDDACETAGAARGRSCVAQSAFGRAAPGLSRSRPSSGPRGARRAVCVLGRRPQLCARLLEAPPRRSGGVAFSAISWTKITKRRGQVRFGLGDVRGGCYRPAVKGQDRGARFACAGTDYV